ncbi:MAG: site-specific integrase [Holosporaceae bacterium]|jgi:integrase|nr:site-specific integrase [Holosporaceae bacterium]
MTVKWIKVENVKGLRYYEHSTRIYKKRKDRNFSLTYKLDGQTKTESLGWESNGWTIEKASAVMNELRQNQRTGEGARTLAEKRGQAQKQKEEKQAKVQEKESETITFSRLYEMYMEKQKTRTEKNSWTTEEGFYKNWFSESLSDRPINDITLDDLQEVINNAQKAGRSPTTAKYMKAFVRQMFNFAIDRNLGVKDNPASKIFIPSFDNRRIRFLTMDEIKKILASLKPKSQQMHDMTLLSMLTGAREGEIFSMQWENINFNTKLITLVDTKNNNKTRHIPMTEEVEKLLRTLKQKDSQGFVFKTKEGNQMQQLSKTFARTIEELGLNNGIIDKRQRVVFHTLRHSYASWLMMEGADLFVVKELMGHSTTAMTERYSHLSPEHLKKTASLLNKHKITS